ncbi:MAG: hypothetical protein M0006_09825 [Magnetospirillum sp.]|nr:hypothetical protein [Magnetospirillum sp.]
MNVSGVTAYSTPQQIQSQGQSTGAVPDGDGDHGHEPTARNSAYTVQLSPQAQQLLGTAGNGSNG